MGKKSYVDILFGAYSCLAASIHVYVLFPCDLCDFFKDATSDLVEGEMCQVINSNPPLLERGLVAIFKWVLFPYNLALEFAKKMSKLRGFLDLLKGPLQIISQNGKLIAMTTIVYLTLYSVSFILYTFSANPIIIDLVLKLFALVSAHPGTPEYTKLLVAIREDIGIFLGIETVFVVFCFLVLIFVQTTIITIASSYYRGDNLSLEELISKVSRTWTRPFVTSIYVQLLALGYMSVFFMPFLIPSLILFDHPIILKTVLIFLAILFITFNLYLSVVWVLAVVVSVFEDTYGLSALGKARELVKGKRVDGFLLNLFFTLVLLVIFMVGFKLSPAMPIVVGLIQVVFMGLVSMFQSLAYSVFYYQCKNNLKISRGLEYSQIATAPVIDENLP